jgi:hypothetical protein
VERATTLASSTELVGSLRRVLVDAADDLGRALAARGEFWR